MLFGYDAFAAFAHQECLGSRVCPGLAFKIQVPPGQCFGLAGTAFT
jgi:hypothetical protein